MIQRKLLPLAAALALAGSATAAAPVELEAPRMPPTTVMEREMEDLRHEMNALAAELERIRGATDPAERRALLRAHLARLREATASMRAMDSRMHEALDRGQIASDRGARERHAFLLDHLAATVALLEATLVETQALEPAGR